MTTSTPPAIEGMREAYKQVAAEARPEDESRAGRLARSLAVAGMRRARLAETAGRGEDDEAPQFAMAAAWLLNWARAKDPETAEIIAGELPGWCGKAGEWLRGHAVALGIDAVEVDRLAIAEGRLLAAHALDAEQAAREMAEALNLARAGMEAIHKIADAHERVMFAALIDLQRGDPAAAVHLLGLQLDGFDGKPANENETGMEYLNRMRDERKATAEPEQAAPARRDGNYEQFAESLFAPVKGEVARLRNELAAAKARDEAEFLADAASLDADFQENR